MTGTSTLLAAAIAVPLGMLLSCLWPAALNRIPACLPLAPAPALAAALFAHSGSPLTVGSHRLSLNFALDVPGALFLGAAALLWIAAGAYALSYPQRSAIRGRFVICWLIALTGCTGVFLAGDMLSFYFFLSLLTVGACGLTVCNDTPRAWRAGATYAVVALLAESSLLVAFVMLAAEMPGDSLLIRDAAASLAIAPDRNVVMALLIAGFGLKAGLVPFHFWMPMAYSAAPVPASAVLSGAIVKASILGTMRFLPLDAANPEWGAVLTILGFFTALYGIVVGITKRDMKIVLAYSSVSQMGFMVAVIGAGMTSGDGSVIWPAAFYAAHHVLAKGALFLSIGVIAASGRHYLRWAILPVAIVALGIGGLPLTGGGLAKIVVDGKLGDGASATAAKMCATGTTLLMLHFLCRLASHASQNPFARPAAGLVRSWMAAVGLSLAAPWVVYLMAPAEPLPSPFEVAVVWKGAWPIVIGAVLAILLSKWMSRPNSDPVRKRAGTMNRLTAAASGVSRSVGMVDWVLGQWPAASMSLLTLIIAFGAAVLAR